MLSGKKDPSPMSEGSVPKDDRHKFRLMAEYRPLVAGLIEEGTVARGKILTAIRAHRNGDEARESGQAEMKDPPGEGDVVRRAIPSCASPGHEGICSRAGAAVSSAAPTVSTKKPPARH
jgi:hypothetical protein